MFKKFLPATIAVVLVCIFGVDKVSALSQFGATANFVLGQPSLEGCATGPNGWGYDKSVYLNGSQVSVYDGKLVIPSGNEYRVLIYNAIPTQNYPSADVVVGGSTTCNRYPSFEASEQLNTPMGVAYDGTNFLVSEYYSNRINIYSHGLPTSSGQIPDFVIGQPERSDSYKSANQGGSVGANTLYYPFSIQIVDGKLIVADRGNNRVLIYNSVPTANNTAADVVIGQPNMTSNTANNGGVSAKSLNAVRGVYSDGTKLIISDSGNSRLLIFNTIPTSNFAEADVVVGQPNMTSNTANNGGISAQTLSTPYGVHVGVDAKLYVADYNNNRVLIYNTIPTSDYALADTVVGQPNMAANTANNGGIGANTLYGPSGVTTYNGKMVIAEVVNNRVLVFNSIPTSNSTAADVVVGQPDMVSASANIIKTTGITASSLAMPYRIMYDGSKTFVTDYANHRILIYNGLPSTSGAPADVVVGQADMVSNTVAVTANRLGWVSGGGFSDGTKLFVADSGNSRLLIFNSIPTSNNASADVVIGQPNKTSNTANNGGISAKSLNGGGRPYSDGTRLFVVDSSNHRVLIFNSIPTTDFASADVVIGQPNMTSNTANNGGISDHSLSSPASVFVRDGKLYIADSSNHRVLIFNSVPTTNNASADVVIGQPDMVSNVINNGGISNRALNYPSEAVVDELGNLIISDRSNSRALIFNGIPTTNFEEADTVVGQTDFISRKVGAYDYGFNNVGSALIADNKLYIADNFGDRILGFTLGPKNTTLSVPAAVNTAGINLTLSADDAKDVMVSENADLSGASWQSFSASLPFTLSSGDGTKTVYVKYRDYVNYEGSVLSVTTTLDTAAPTGAMTINSGATLTKTKEVTLTLTSADSAQMKISNASDFDGASWESYSATKAHTLATGDGLKTVYVKYKDEAGNQSETYSATITLDTKKPTTKITELGLITDVPDKTPLFYYFTSQTPRIKGTTEALSTVHFEYGEEDYTTSASADGNYEITLPELPRELVELTYYAVDPAGNQGAGRILKLTIGVENFPAELVTIVEPKTEEPIVAPTDGTATPTPSTTPVMTVYGVLVVDAEGKKLANTTIYINGQEYRTNEDGKVYLEAKPTEAMEYEVEVNGKRVKGTVLGDQIKAEAVQTSEDENGKKSYTWILILVGALGIFFVVRLLLKRRTSQL